MSSDEKKEEKKYDVALDTRKFEIDLFWKRSIFFWGFIAAAFVAYATFSGDKANNPHLRLLIALFGLVCSFCWTLTNRGSKYWQENWEQHVDVLEDKITGKLFKDRKPPKKKFWWFRARKFSVSKLTIALSDYTVFVWFGLTLYNLRNLSIALPFFESNRWPIHFNEEETFLIFFMLTIVWLIFIFLFARTSENDLNTYKQKDENKKDNLSV